MTPEYLKAVQCLVSAFWDWIDDNKQGVDLEYTSEPIEVGPDWKPHDLVSVDRGRRVLIVSAAHSDTSIYGLAGNLLFRAAHDLAHMKYGLGFTVEEELRLAEIHWLSLRVYVPAECIPMAHAIYMADTSAQSLYYKKHGHFPKDQTKFVLGVLRAQGWV